MTHRITIKRLAGRLASAFPRPQGRRIVLLYHSIGDGPWAIPRASFARQMAKVAEIATIVDLAALVDGSSEFVRDRPSVAVTFDDGYASLLDEAAPVLRDVGAGATVFLNTGHIGDVLRERSDAALGHYPGETFLTWPELEPLIAAGWHVGAHGVRHLDFSMVPGELAEAELAESKAAIELRLGRPCDIFAYTWGRHTPALREIVRRVGFRQAMTGKHAPICMGDDPLLLPRVNIAADYSERDVVAIIRGDWDFLGWGGRLRRRDGGR